MNISPNYFELPYDLPLMKYLHNKQFLRPIFSLAEQPWITKETLLSCQTDTHRLATVHRPLGGS